MSGVSILVFSLVQIRPILRDVISSVYQAIIKRDDLMKTVINIIFSYQEDIKKNSTNVVVLSQREHKILLLISKCAERVVKIKTFSTNLCYT